MLRKTRLKKRSRKREREWAIYLRKRAEFLSSHTSCYAMVSGDCTWSSEDVHHRKGRHGKLLNDTRYWLAVCRPCHDWIESHKRESRKRGYILYK